MTKDQKTVALGALSGVLGMIVLVCFFYSLYPASPSDMDLPARLAFTLRMNVLAVLPLFVMIAMVGNGRFLTKAIDPLKHEENKMLEINGRVADNTLQQNLVFLIGTLALATYLDGSMMHLIAALTTVFVIARLAFWFGYRKDPLYRAPGMAATAYMNLGILLTCVYFIFTSI